MPITEFIRNVEPAAPDEVLAAADNLKYRDFLTVCLIVNRTDLFPDNWIYVARPRPSTFGRIQNFKNWSPTWSPIPPKPVWAME
jgi:protoporphyrinogen oxidase